MAFAIMPCSYCGGAIKPCDDRSDICQSCGKRLYKSRSDLRTFTRAVDREEDFGPVMDMIGDDNIPKALSTMNSIIANDPEDRDAYFSEIKDFVKGKIATGLVKLKPKYIL